MNFFVRHLKEAKVASGNNEDVTVRDYFLHMILGLVETASLFAFTIAALLHSIFPFLFGFGMIQWKINTLRRLKKKLPNLKLWEQIELKDEKQ